MWETVRNSYVNTSRPRQNERHLADDILNSIFLNENVWIPIEISLKFVPKGPIYNIPSLVQIMAWRRPGDKPLSEPMMVRLPTHVCVVRPQWVLTKPESNTVECAVNGPISQIPQSIKQISHNIPFCNRNVHTWAHDISYKMMHCGLWNWCNVGYGTSALLDSEFGLENTQQQSDINNLGEGPEVIGQEIQDGDRNLSTITLSHQITYLNYWHHQSKLHLCCKKNLNHFQAFRHWRQDQPGGSRQIVCGPRLRGWLL